VILYKTRKIHLPKIDFVCQFFFIYDQENEKKIDKLVCPKVWLFLPALYTISYYPFWHFPPNFDRNLKESTETTKKSFSTT